jgi:polysaccharide chain length determinant protein (PEP-CTERM system associated)
MHLGSLIRRQIAAGWRHRWKALLVAWLVCIVGWTAVYLMPNQYQSNARIYADAEAILGTLLRGIAIEGSPATQVEMLQRTLLSRPNLERVIAKTDLDLRVTDMESRERLIESLGKTIKITPQTRQLFQIEYTDSDPRLARDVIQALITLFMEAAASNDRAQLQAARQFVQQQISAYEVQLRDAERRRAEFRARYVDLLPGEGGTGFSRLESVRERLAEFRGTLIDAQGKRDLVRQQLEATPAMFPASAVPGGGDGRVAAAERQLAELRLRYTDQHPDVVAQRAVIAELRRSGGGAAPARPGQPARSSNVPNPLHEQLRLRLVDADAEVASLERQVRETSAEVERLEGLARTAPHVQAEYVNLDRDYAVLRRNYEELLGRRESLALGGAARTDADRVRMDVVEPPTVPTVPIGPKRLLFASAVLIIGLGAGGALAFLLAQLDRGFYTVHDLRSLGLPVLGGVSAAVQPRQTGAAMVFAGGVSMLILAYVAVLAGGPTLIKHMPVLVARLLARLTT